MQKIPALGFLLVLTLLVLSVLAYRSIGFGPFPGVDFHNIYQFHNCVLQGDLYRTSGAQCGDQLGRAFIYPPLLYWAFTWVRAFSFQTAYDLWDAFIILGLMASLCAWGQPRSLRFWLYTVLLMLQLPVFYALERGNNDILVVLLWTGMYLAWQRKRPVIAGTAAAAAGMAKVYPWIAAAALAAGMIRELGRSTRTPGIRFALGFLAASAALLLVAPSLWREYFLEVLPAWAVHPEPRSITSHSLSAIFPGQPGIPLAIRFTLLLAWAFAAWKSLKTDPPLIFAGALAISTYFGNVANDYSLITTYPLLIVLLSRAWNQHFERKYFFLLLLGTLAIAGNRMAFARIPGYSVEVHTLLQVVWLWLTAAAAACQTSIFII